MTELVLLGRSLAEIPELCVLDKDVLERFPSMTDSEIVREIGVTLGDLQSIINKVYSLFWPEGRIRHCRDRRAFITERLKENGLNGARAQSVYTEGPLNGSGDEEDKKSQICISPSVNVQVVEAPVDEIPVVAEAEQSDESKDSPDIQVLAEVFDTLTPAKRELAELIGQGLSIGKIAKKLYRKPSSVQASISLLLKGDFRIKEPPSVAVRCGYVRAAYEVYRGKHPDTVDVSVGQIIKVEEQKKPPQEKLTPARAAPTHQPVTVPGVAPPGWYEVNEPQTVVSMYTYTGSIDTLEAQLQEGRGRGFVSETIWTCLHREIVFVLFVKRLEL